MKNGTVKFFNEHKGFGFIQPEDGAADAFVHVSTLERCGISTLIEGQKVTFESEMDERKGKPKVSKVEIADA